MNNIVTCSDLSIWKFRYQMGYILGNSDRIKIAVNGIQAEATTGADGRPWCESRLRGTLAGMDLKS